MSAYHHIVGFIVLGVLSSSAPLSAPREIGTLRLPAPALLTQVPFSTAEPPLAGSPLQPRPGMTVPFGTPYPVDPPVPVVAIRVRVAAQSAPKQEIEYRMSVHNTSSAPAHHVLVRNPLPANARFVRATPEPTRVDPEVQWQLGTLQPGACREITLVLLPTTDQDVRNCARVQFEHGQCVTTRIGGPAPSIPPSPPPLGAAKLTVTLTGPAQQYVNLPAKYQLTVRNEGTGPASSVVLSNVLPPHTKLVAASAGAQMHMQQVAWQLGTLEAGGTRIVQFVLRADTSGDLLNRAVVLWDRDQRAQTDLRTRFIGTSALHLDVRDTKDPIAVGEGTSYVITVDNQGSVPVTNVRVRVLVPAEMKLLRATGAAKPPDAKDLPPPTKLGQELTFEVIKELPARQQARFEVFVEGVRAGDVRFNVELTADQLKSGPVTQQESTTVVPNR